MLCRRREWTVLAAWLKEQTVSWNNYLVGEALRAEEDDRRLAEYLQGEDEKWFKGIPTPASLLALDCELTPEELAEKRVAYAEEKTYCLAVPREVEQYLHYFCGHAANPNALSETEALRVSFYKAVATLVRAFAAIA